MRAERVAAKEQIPKKSAPAKVNEMATEEQDKDYRKAIKEEKIRLLQEQIK